MLLAGELGAGKTDVRPGLRRRPRRRPNRSPARRSRWPRTYHGPPAAAPPRRLPPRAAGARSVDLGLAEVLDAGGVTLVEWGDAILRGAARRLPRGAAELGDERRRPRRSPCSPVGHGLASCATGRAVRRQATLEAVAMLILGIESATGQVGCAIGGHEGVLAAVRGRLAGRRHAETLAPAIEFFCRQARHRPVARSAWSPSTSAPACSPACGSASPPPRRSPTRCGCR